LYFFLFSYLFFYYAQGMLSIDLKGKKAFIAGVGDDQGFGWAIAKALAAAGAQVIVGTWPPMLKIFTTGLEMGKFDESRFLPNGTKLEFAKIYPFDGAFDSPEDVPTEIKENKRYKDCSGYTISEVAKLIENDFGNIDILVHSLANAPEAQKPLLETSRKGYLSAVGTSAYSLVSMLAHFGPIINQGGAVLSLTYIASERVVPGYGGGLNAAKAALESDTRTLSFEAGRKWGIRVNTISAGPYASRAAKAIGFIEKMISYCQLHAPLKKELEAIEVGHTAAFLASPLASGITGATIYVDNGMHAMAAAPTA
jgi:enoyl-[acyl-carrier protein] reductase I